MAREPRISHQKWLRVKPPEWRQDRLKDIVPLILGGGTPPSSDPDCWEDGDIVWVTPTDFTLSGSRAEIFDSERKITRLGLESSAAALLPANTVIMASRATIGAVRIAGTPLATNQGFVSFVCDDAVLYHRFLFYVISGFLGHYFAEIAPGTTFSEISRGRAKVEPIAFPRCGEQEQIAAYLDASCKVIDAAVTAKRRQIKTLDALHGAILLTALTKGIQTGGNSQQTHSSALPHIPVGWTLKRLKSVATIRYGLGQPPAQLDSGVGMIRATDIDAGRISTDNLMRVDPQDLPIDRKPYLEAGEIIVVRSGAYTGDSAIVTPELEGCVAGYDMVVTVTKASPQFVAYCLLSRYVLEGQLLLLTLRAAQPHLNAEELGSVVLALPPTRSEQDAIVAYLDKKLAEVRRLMLGIERQIETLTAYRKSLIHECVTGLRRVTEGDVKRLQAYA